MEDGPLTSGLRAAALALLAAVVLLLVAPWGEYPLNDDWQYARVAERLARTGAFVVDVAVAPSLLVQCAAVAPLVRASGFSHVALRLATYLVALVALWAVGRLLRLAGVDGRVRLLAQALLLLNPLFLHVSLSFMTEIWGLAPALLGAALWFAERRRVLAGAEPGGGVLRARAVVAAAALVALGFWSRQHVAVVFPALVGSLLLVRPRAGGGGGPASIRSLLAPLVPGTLVFGALVAAYPLWARATGNLRPQFSGPFAAIFEWDASAWHYGLSAQPYYQTLFLLPLLVLVPWRGLPKARTAAVAAALLVFAAVAAASFATLPTPELATFVHKKRVFPFLPNVVYNAGVGPVTFEEVYFGGEAAPGLGVVLGIGLEAVLGLATVLWAPMIVRRRAVPAPSAAIRRELAAFGALWAAGSLVLVLQAHQVQLFDRYLLPVTTGLLLAVAASVGSPGLRKLGPAAALLVPLGWFSLAGVHDYFRWNDARWDAVRSLLSRGVDPGVVSGGWEVDGWLSFDSHEAGRKPSGCIGPCGCAVSVSGWPCVDDSYRIAMHPVPGYEVLETRKVGSWLAPCPPIHLLRRLPGAGPDRRRQ